MDQTTPHITPKGRSRLRGVFGNLLLAATAVTTIMVVIATMGEGLVRYRERHRITVPGTMPLLFYRHGALGLALVRDYDYFGWVHTNRFGFRGTETTVLPREGTTRIMAVGGSTTFDSFVTADEKTWPERLEFWLNQLAPENPIEVINAGVPGYTVSHNMLRLERELHQYQPDLLVLYHTHNDLFGALRAGTELPAPYDPTPGHVPLMTPWEYWVTRHSLLYAKLRSRWKAIRFREIGRRALRSLETPSVDLRIDQGVKKFEHDLTIFLAVAKTYDIPVVIVGVSNVSGVGTSEEPDATIRAMWENALPFATSEGLLRGYCKFTRSLQAVAKRSRITFISAEPFAIAGKQWYYPEDPIHFNDAGADRMAKALAVALLETEMIQNLNGAGAAPREHP